MSLGSCQFLLVSPPAAAEETFPWALQHCGYVCTLGSEDQKN